MRSRHPSAEKGFPTDLAGAFDFWLVKNDPGDADNPPDVDWLFVQVTSWGHRAEKLKKIAEWDAKNRIPYGIMIRLDTYQPPHFEGRGKNKHWVKETTWRSEEL